MFEMHLDAVREGSAGAPTMASGSVSRELEAASAFASGVLHPGQS
jgi:hypothetical protein